jgi:CheY-like chemotaxis protein
MERKVPFDPAGESTNAIRIAAATSLFRQAKSVASGCATGKTMCKILIADDNMASRDLMRAILKTLRCDIVEAEEGQEALDLIWKEQPDVVLLDIDMPVLDGLAVIRNLRREARFADLPVVAVSAYAMEGDREKALAAGFTAYLSKPVRAASLRQEVEQLLRA